MPNNRDKKHLHKRRRLLIILIYYCLRVSYVPRQLMNK